MSRNNPQDPFQDFLSSPPPGSQHDNASSNAPGNVFERLGDEAGDRHLDPFFDE